MYISASTNTTHPTNIITMVSRLLLQRHGFGESAEASLEGVGQGRSKRILLTIIIGRRKKLICKLDDLF
jgi:hypothetical protein